ncbi:hypothetical protein, partial [Nocardioides sp.]|uniref:hypothetical protein n=1 Tax=Nocardioides sp. TaxID=35761 RepID=UPI00260E1BBF
AGRGAPARLLGALGPLLDAMTSADPELRPPTAAAALERLRRIEVPTDRPWPHVPDRLPEPPAARVSRWADVAIACFAGVIALCAVAVYLLLS